MASAVPRRRVQAVERQLLKTDGTAIAITLKLNPRARRLIVRVNPSTGEVAVVAPSRAALSHAMEFARKQAGWITRRLEQVPPPLLLDLGQRIPFRGQDHLICAGEREAPGAGTGPVWLAATADGERCIHVNGRPEHAARRILDFLKREAHRTLDAQAMQYARMLGVRPARIVVRDPTSRWGSCSSARNLSFSWRLILAPAFVLDYVVAHEVAHLREMNHGRHFWQLVEEMVGDYARAQTWLSENGARLHRYTPRIANE